MNEFADELLKGERSGKYSPIEVAQWLENLASSATTAADAAQAAQDAEIARRMASMCRCKPASAASSPRKFRAGVYYAIHEKNQRRAARSRKR